MTTNLAVTSPPMAADTIVRQTAAAPAGAVIAPVLMPAVSAVTIAIVVVLMRHPLQVIVRVVAVVADSEHAIND